MRHILVAAQEPSTRLTLTSALETRTYRVPTEWRLLATLLRNPGRLVSRGRLLGEVWGPAAEQKTNYPRVYLSALCRKLEPDPGNPRHFITEPGLGYRFDP